MRNINKLLLILLLTSSINQNLNAAEKSKLYSDVPINHWAYQAIEELTEKGLINGLPNGCFQGNKPLTRYSFAVVISRMLNKYNELIDNGNIVSKKDLKAIEDLTSEFINEIEIISNDIKDIKSDIKEINNEIATVKNDVENLSQANNKSNDRLNILEKVKVSGDLLAQNISYSKTAKNVDDFQNMQVRIGIHAEPTEKIDADFQYVAYDKDFDSNRDEKFVKNSVYDYNGTSKSKFGRANGTNKVEIAKIKVKNVLNDNDYLQIGRDFKTHGHALVLNDYADTITYGTKSGNVDLTANVIYADYDNGINPNKKGKQILNINADTTVKGHNIYAGIYHQDTNNHYSEIATGTYIKDFDKQLRQIAEIGSKGNISKDNKVRYDVALVGSYKERKNLINDGKKDKATGYMEHVALTWDASPNLTVKTAYTTADKDFDGIISLDKNQGSVGGTTTPFDDIARFQNLLGGMMNDNFSNTSDFKFQLEYAFANNQSLRFAYDIVKENDNYVKSGFTPMGQKTDNWNMAGYNKLDAKISTLEYKYQFDPSTRFSLGLTNADKSNCRDENNAKTKDENLFWTEMFTKF